MPGKNSYSGLEWAVHPAALLSELDNEENVKKELKKLLNIQENNPIQKNLLEEVKAAVEAWYKVYHAVVLLVATIYPLEENVEINRPEPHREECASNPDKLCLALCHVVTAYTFAEDYPESIFTKYGVVLEQRIREDFVRRRLGIEGDGSTFVDQNLSAQPQFKFFFDKLKPFLVKSSDDFFIPQSNEWNQAAWVQKDYLGKFRSAVSDARVSSETRANYDTYVERLHQLLAELWGTDIKAKLEKMDRWRRASDSVGSEAWWTNDLGLIPLRSAISSWFAGSNTANIITSNKTAAIAYLNDLIYTFIRIRFAEPDDTETSHGLMGVLDRYAELNRLAGASDEELQIWDDILAITSGAIAWQIYRQASSTVEAMKALI